MYVDLFRLMCATPILFAASIALGEVLVADRRFLFYGLAPLLYNAGIVIGTLLFASRFGIFAAAIGALLGAVLHLAHPRRRHPPDLVPHPRPTAGPDRGRSASSCG